jgi:MinD superfamily P-loop ATPase
MINRMMRKNKGILEKLRENKVILNKCALNSEDIATFEYETKLNVLFSIPYVDDRQDSIEVIRKFANKINL